MSLLNIEHQTVSIMECQIYYFPVSSLAVFVENTNKPSKSPSAAGSVENYYPSITDNYLYGIHKIRVFTGGYQIVIIFFKNVSILVVNN